MDTEKKNVFHEILLEEFEKQKDRKPDVVAEKRKQFNALLNEAHNELRKKSYDSASKNYYSIVLFMTMDPYLDELQISQEMEYAIKCCFSYSGLMNPNRFKEADISKILVDVVKELSSKFRTRMFTMFLLVLLNFHTKNWLTTLTWCDEIRNFSEQDEENENTCELFKSLLPNLSEIKHQVEYYEEVAFFGYGEKITKNALLKPHYEKYKKWTSNLEDFIVNKIGQLRPPVSESDLHTIFHHDVFPIWCLANGKDDNGYYSDKFANKCTQCIRAKLYGSLAQNPESPIKDKAMFDSFLTRCAELYKKFANESSVLDSLSALEGKKQSLTSKGGENAKRTPVKKHNCSASSQTEKVKISNKNIQTENPKTRTIEVQVGTESQVLSAILEIKNKCLAQQEKKDDTITKLNRKINELQEKLNKEINSKKTMEHEFEKKTANFKFEIQKLKEQLTKNEKKQNKETEKRISLQKLLVEQVNDKYNLHKQHYKIFEKHTNFMVLYLKDLLTFLTPKSIPNEVTCKQNIEKWENQLQSIKGGIEQLNVFYQNARVDMINSDIYNTPWPDLLEFPVFEDNLVFFSFKAAIRNIIQTEEKLYWNYATDQKQRTANVAQIHNFAYSVPQPQFPPQNNVYLGQRIVYSTATASPIVPQGQFPNLAVPVPLNVDPRQISEQHRRRSKSTELLGATQASRCATPTKTNWNSSSVENKKETILLDYVLERCAGATEEEVTLALLSLLEENKGSLTNLSKEKIVEDVKVILRIKKQTAWVTPKSPHVDWHKEQAEKECSICFEEFSLQDKYTLPCQHEYHKECIRKWLKTSSVCPICRIHSVIDEEFPPLH